MFFSDRAEKYVEILARHQSSHCFSKINSTQFKRAATAKHLRKHTNYYKLANFTDIFRTRSHASLLGEAK